MKIRYEGIERIYFMVILFSMLIGSTWKYLTFFALGISFLMAFFIASRYSKKTTADVPLGIIVILVFQNLCIGIGAHLTENFDSSLKLITQIPFGVTFIVFIYLIFSHKELFSSMENIFFIILLVLILLSMSLGYGSLQSILVNVRNMTVFFMAYEIGFALSDNEKKESKIFQKKVLSLSVIVFFVGLVLYFGGYEFYKAIGINEVYFAKGASTYLNNALDGRFTSDLFGFHVYRMGSLYYEPVNLAYFFSFTFLISFYGDYSTNKTKWFFYSIINGVGLILTFGKGGFLLTGGVFFCRFVQKIAVVLLGKRNKKLLIVLVVGLVSIFVVGFVTFYYSRYGGAVRQHFYGISRTWRSILDKPFGHGLGTGGNASRISNSLQVDWLGSGGETALLSFAYQIGFIGTFVLILLFLMISSNPRFLQLHTLDSIFVYIPILLIGASIFQDNTFTPQCIIPFMLLAGIVKGHQKTNLEGRANKKRSIIARY